MHIFVGSSHGQKVIVQLFVGIFFKDRLRWLLIAMVHRRAFIWNLTIGSIVEVPYVFMWRQVALHLKIALNELLLRVVIAQFE